MRVSAEAIRRAVGQCDYCDRPVVKAADGRGSVLLDPAPDDVDGTYMFVQWPPPAVQRVTNLDELAELRQRREGLRRPHRETCPRAHLWDPAAKRAARGRRR